MAGICREELPNPEGPDDDLERLVVEAITLAEGDMRRAIRALILGQHEIEAEKAAQVSAGYIRRGLY
ncbi:hypothetical protein [Aureimonas endophytica]|nr:hypothetical protein [Aureimonas endophytica]